LSKADNREIQKLQDIKTNKEDTEMSMRNIDILHKQVTHIIVLLTELVKTNLQQKKESFASIQQRQMYILWQCMNVVNWVNLFNPQTVNTNDFKLPPELKELNDHSKLLTKEYPGNTFNTVVPFMKESSTYYNKFSTINPCEENMD